MSMRCVGIIRLCTYNCTAEASLRTLSYLLTSHMTLLFTAEASLRTLSVEIGEILTAMGENNPKYVDDLMLKWDPNRDGSISLMEWRQAVKKLVPKADVKEV